MINLKHCTVERVDPNNCLSDYEASEKARLDGREHGGLLTNSGRSRFTGSFIKHLYRSHAAFASISILRNPGTKERNLSYRIVPVTLSSRKLHSHAFINFPLSTPKAVTSHGSFHSMTHPYPTVNYELIISEKDLSARGGQHRFTSSADHTTTEVYRHRPGFRSWAELNLFHF